MIKMSLDLKRAILDVEARTNRRHVKLRKRFNKILQGGDGTKTSPRTKTATLRRSKFVSGRLSPTPPAKREKEAILKKVEKVKKYVEIINNYDPTMLKSLFDNKYMMQAFDNCEKSYKDLKQQCDDKNKYFLQENQLVLKQLERIKKKFDELKRAKSDGGCKQKLKRLKKQYDDKIVYFQRKTEDRLQDFKKKTREVNEIRERIDKLSKEKSGCANLKQEYKDYKDAMKQNMKRAAFREQNMQNQCNEKLMEEIRYSEECNKKLKEAKQPFYKKILNKMNKKGKKYVGY